MKTKYIILSLMFSVFTTYTFAQDDHDDHEEEAPAIKFSKIVDGVEIFAEYPALVRGENSRFIAHFTNLVNYKPISDAMAHLSYGGKSIDSADKVLRNGIFILNFTPKQTGNQPLVITLKYAGQQYAFQFKHSRVHSSIDEAGKQLPAEMEPDIVFLKEQAWIGTFGVAEVQKKVFTDVIHTSGEILPAVDNRITIVAQGAGIVNLDKNLVVGKRFNAGQRLAALKGGQLENSREVAQKVALATYNDVSARYVIASQLVKDQTISQKEYASVKAYYESAKAKLEVYGNINDKGEFTPRNGTSQALVVAPRAGTVSSVKVNNGDFVNSGDVIAELTVGDSYLLKVDFPKHEISKIKGVKDANFVPEYMVETKDKAEVYSVSEMGGVPMYSSKQAAGRSPYIPFYFNLPSNDKLIPNSFAKVSLMSEASQAKEQLIIPISALLENEGNYWVYVEMEGENYTEREVFPGDNNGREVVILEGLKEGEVVVTKGAYRVKQAASSGEIPEHTH